MPRKKKEEEVAADPTVEAPVEVKAEAEPEKKKVSPADLRELLKKKAEPVKGTDNSALKEPLQPGQAYFEAPDGTVLIGDADRDHMIYKGMRINKRREPTPQHR